MAGKISSLPNCYKSVFYFSDVFKNERLRTRAGLCVCVCVCLSVCLSDCLTHYKLPLKPPNYVTRTIDFAQTFVWVFNLIDLDLFTHKSDASLLLNHLRTSSSSLQQFGTVKGSEKKETE